MNIAFEMVGTHSGGGLTVAKNILHAMQNDPGIERIELFCSPVSDWSEPLNTSEKIHVNERPQEARNYVARFHWLTRGFNAALKGRKIDRVFSCNANCVSDRSTSAYLHQPLLFDATVHPKLPIALRARLPVIKQLTRAACRRASNVIVQTKWMARAAIETFGISDDRVVTIPGVVDNSATEPAAGRYRFIFVGNEQRYKQFDLARSAIQNASDDRTVLLATLPALESYEDRVLRLGVVPRDSLLETFRSCTALVFPSLIESFGFPLAEAMANGLPVFAIDRPYARDVCGDAACYFENRNELVALIDRANIDKPFCENLGRLGLARNKERNQMYSWQSVVDVVKR